MIIIPMIRNATIYIPSVAQLMIRPITNTNSNMLKIPIHFLLKAGGATIATTIRTAMMISH